MTDLALVVSLALGLPLLLQLVDDVLVTPTDLVRQPLQGAVLPAGLESEDTESGGNNHLLDLVLGGGNTLEQSETGQSGGTSRRLVGNHSSDGLVEDPRGSSEVEGTGLLGVAVDVDQRKERQSGSRSRFQKRNETYTKCFSTSGKSKTG